MANANRERKMSGFTLPDDVKQGLVILCEKRGQKMSVAIERMIRKELKAAGIKLPETEQAS